MNSKPRSKRSKRLPRNQRQALLPTPARPLINNARRRERLVARYSGASVTLATGAGYSWFTIDSTRFVDASPWTALSNLYMFVRPISVRITVTSSRSTSTSDNPFVGFVATPDGVAVGSTSMNISTFEAPNVVTRTLPPGVESSYFFRPFVAVAAYNTPTNGYIPFPCPRISVNNIPRVYFGDLLIATPGVTLTTTANYLQIKLEYVMEFDTLDNANIQ
jgi:hypothetical protein